MTNLVPILTIILGLLLTSLGAFFLVQGIFGLKF